MSATWNFARRPFRDDRPVFAAAAALVLVGLVLLVANLRIFARYRHDVADVHGEIAALETRQRAADEKSRAAKAALASYRLSSLAEQSRELSRLAAERRFSWTLLLARLEKTLPGDVGVVRLQPVFDKDGQVLLELQLVARNRDAVVPTITAFSKDPAFSAIELRTESSPEGSTTEPYLFQVTGKYAAESRP